MQPRPANADQPKAASLHQPNIDIHAFHEFERQGWETSASAYSQHLGRLTSAAIPRLLDAVDAQTGTRLIDLATGPGYVAAATHQRGCYVVAVDFSENMIALAKSRNDPRIDFQVADVEKLPQADASFDAALMNFGILHLSQPERGLSEIFRLLKPGGKMAFTVWAGPEEAEGLNLVRRAIETFGNPNVSIPDGPSFFAFADSVHTDRVLTDLGFVTIAAQNLSLVWVLDSAQDLFTALYEGTARTGELLRRQHPDALEAIQRAVAGNCAPYVSDGKARIPMPAILHTAAKPADSSTSTPQNAQNPHP